MLGWMLEGSWIDFFGGFCSKLGGALRQVGTKINPKTNINFNMTMFQKLLQN